MKTGLVNIAPSVVVRTVDKACDIVQRVFDEQAEEADGEYEEVRNTTKIMHKSMQMMRDAESDPALRAQHQTMLSGMKRDFDHMHMHYDALGGDDAALRAEQGGQIGGAHSDPRVNTAYHAKRHIAMQVQRGGTQLPTNRQRDLTREEISSQRVNVDGKRRKLTDYEWEQRKVLIARVFNESQLEDKKLELRESPASERLS